MDLYIGNRHIDKQFTTATTYPVTPGDNKYNAVANLPYIYWGSNNLFPNRALETARLNSIVHRVKDKLANDIGKFRIKGTEKEVEKTKLIFKKIGLYEILDQLLTDMAWFNGFSVQTVVKNGLIEALYYQSFSNVRSGILPVDLPKDYFIANDWSVIDITGRVKVYNVVQPELADAYKPKRLISYKYIYEKTKEERIKAPKSKSNTLFSNVIGNYKFENIENNENYAQIVKTIETELDVLLWYDYKPTNIQFYYPILDVESVLTEIELIESIAVFYKNSMQNGAFSSGIYMYPKKQNPDRDKELREQKEIVDNIMITSTGPENAGKPVVIFYDNFGDEKFVPSFLSAPEGKNDTKWLSVLQIVETQIFAAVGVVTPELFGFSKASGFTSQAETLKIADKLFYEHQVLPRQKWFVENFLNKIIENYGLNIEIDYERYEELPLTLDMVSAGVITVDEWREYNGLNPLNTQTNG